MTIIFYKNLPSTFITEEDQGFFTVSINLPEGTSANLTRKSADKISAEIKKFSSVENVITISGFYVMTSGGKSNAATLFVRLKLWEDRKTFDTKVKFLINQTLEVCKKISPESRILAFNPPVLPGLGNFGGWTMQLQDMSGHTDEELQEISNKLLAKMNQNPKLRGVRSNFRIDSPIYNFEINRDKINELGADFSEIFTAIQVNYGGLQVNNFNRFGRSYKVVLQAEKNFRNSIDTTKSVFVKNFEGKFISLDNFINPRKNTGASVISRFNATRSITFQGNSAENFSSGEAMDEVEKIIKNEIPSGFNIEWSGQSREEKNSQDATIKILILSLIFVFLCLAALYESWSVPLAILLTIPTGIFGAIFLEFFCGLQNSVYVQIGIIMIIGLAAKNAILIVEFAKIRVDGGNNLIKSALKAAELRFRPILMTSFAFIIGCLPLAFASGAGASARNEIGIAR